MWQTPPQNEVALITAASPSQRLVDGLRRSFAPTTQLFDVNAVPRVGVYLILRDTKADFIHPTEGVLRPSFSLSGGSSHRSYILSKVVYLSRTWQQVVTFQVRT